MRVARTNGIAHQRASKKKKRKKSADQLDKEALSDQSTRHDCQQLDGPPEHSQEAAGRNRISSARKPPMREAAASSVHRGGLESCTPLLVIGVGGIATNHEHPGQCAVVQMPVVNRKVAADQQQYVIDDISVHCKLHDSHGTVVASPACERTWAWEGVATALMARKFFIIRATRGATPKRTNITTST
jgi:hypothetical protein